MNPYHHSVCCLLLLQCEQVDVNLWEKERLEEADKKVPLNRTRPRTTWRISGGFSQLLSKPRLLTNYSYSFFTIFTFLFLSGQKSQTSSPLVCCFCLKRDQNQVPNWKREEAKKKSNQPLPNLHKNSSFDHLALKTWFSNYSTALFLPFNSH